MAAKQTKAPIALSASETQTRLLDTAEALFMQHGYDATTLRQISHVAKVNLAAANYHFGGKEGLFQAALTRRLDPMNQERLRLLDELEQAARGPLRCEKILWAMFLPALRLAHDRARGGKNFLRLLGRAYVDPAPPVRDFLNDRYAEMIARYRQAFAAALPHLPKQEVTWRLHFTLGTMAYALAGTDVMQLIAGLNLHDDDEMLLRRLLPFLVAGLHSPLPDFSRSPDSAP